MGTGHDTHLSLSGLTVLHRSLLSAHLARAGLVQAAPWFRDTHVSIDDLAGLGADQWDQIDEVLQRFASEYQGTLTGTEFARVRDGLSELTWRIADDDAVLIRKLRISTEVED